MSTTPPLPPAAEPQSQKRSGCLIAFVVVLLLLVGGCVVVFGIGYVKRGSVIGWGLDKLSTAAASAMADDVPQETRDEFVAAFATYKSHVVSVAMGEPPPGVDPSKLQLPGEQLQTALQDQSISLEEAQRFIELVQQTRTQSE